MTTTKQIMVVDDNPIDCLIIQKVIASTDAQAEITLFQEAAKALQYLAANNALPETILLDIHMPGMDGWGFLDEFMKLSETIVRHCHVYILTSSIDGRDKSKAQNYPVVANFITKPLTAGKLAQVGIVPVQKQR